MALLTVDYWISLISRFTTCSAEQGQFLICTSKTPVAWFQIAALIGGSIMIAFDKGRRRALAITVLGMIVFLHFYFLIGMEYVLGPVHVLGAAYFYWPLFPFIFAVVVEASAMIVGFAFRKHAPIARWIPAFANTGIAIVGLVIFIRAPRTMFEGTSSG
jgi:CDP-diglyceride synthetase